MREIKFRYFNKRAKTMYPEEYFSLRFDGILMQSMPEDKLLPFDPEYGIVMQYTGLKDKNGKEIYEGDIVKNYVYMGSVKWGNFKAKGEISNYDIKTWIVEADYNYLLEEDLGLEVIGNIYENPELLK